MKKKRTAYNNDYFIFYHNTVKRVLHEATTYSPTVQTINSKITARF